MSRLPATAWAAITAGAAIMAAATLADAGHPLAWQVGSVSQALDCQADALPHHGTLLRLTNPGALPLVRGSRFAWASLGTPAVRGEVRELPRTLALGESVSLVSDIPLTGTGCTAVGWG